MSDHDDLSDLSFDFGALEGVAEEEVGLASYTDADVFPDPDIQTNDPADYAVQELDAIQTGFRERAAQEEQRLNTWVTSGNYLVVVFATNDQRVAFLKGSEWGDAGTAYIDGILLADRMGIDLPETPEWRQPRVNRDYGALGLDPFDQ